ncbi:hypothetical protein [Streptomyces sp. NPDC001536]|uniref:hypothetical protein n=1 Tax=Streptomyces sp. NPDC001536 TaxID=3364583 RepID=UPI0036C50A0B
MTDTEKLSRLFAALGTDDARGWAESEVEENLPQLARYRLLRALSQDIQAWDASSIASLRDESTATADVEDLARAIARETTFNVLYRLADPGLDDLPVDLHGQVPGWALMETTPAGELTGRVLNGLHEDLDTVAPAAKASPSGTIVEGWIWRSNLRPFCESLAAEIAYDFDDSDWLAIDTALPDTDHDQPREAWYTYPLVGRHQVDLHVAQSLDGSEVSVSAEGSVDSRARSRIELLFNLMACYQIASE